MKILKANAGPLTNFELLDLLRSRGASKDPTRVMSLLTPSEFKVYDYLDKSAASTQTRESINEFIEKCKQYQLGKAEVINIINIRPSSEAELAQLIEYEQHGWDENKLLEILEMVGQVLPPHLNQQKSDEEADANGSQQVGDEHIAKQDMDTIQVDAS